MLAELLFQLQEQQADSNHTTGLTAVLEMSWHSLDEFTQQIGLMLSLFAPAPIPQLMLEQIAQTVLSTDINREAIATACDNLIQRFLLQRIDTTTYCLHTPIRSYLQTKLAPSSQGDRFKQAFTQTMADFAKRLSDPPPLEECNAFAPAIPHIIEAATTWQSWLTNESLVFPYFCLGRFCAAQGALNQAAHWYEQCLTSARNQLGGEHLAIATSLTHLANLYYAQYHYQEAEPLYQEALELLKQLLSEHHPAVATSLTNLENLCRAREHSRQAETTALDPLNHSSINSTESIEKSIGEDTHAQSKAQLHPPALGTLTRPLSWRVVSNPFFSFRYAWAGLSYAFQTQHNFRNQIVVGMLAIALSLFLNLSLAEGAIISLAISAVLMMELLNTAIESVVDSTVRQTYHELAKIAKDCAASAVLTSAFASVIVACYLWLPPLLVEIQTTAAGTVVRTVTEVISMAILIVWILVAVIWIFPSFQSPNRSLSWRVASNLFASFGYAWAGVSYTFQTQRNFRIHTTVGSLAILLSLYLKLTRVEIVIISLAISAVLMMELLNTAIESVVDLTVRQTYHELAKIAKDCAASAVLTSAFASVIVACYLWLPPLLVEIQTTAAGTVVRTVTEVISMAILIVWILVAVIWIFSSFQSPNRSLSWRVASNLFASFGYAWAGVSYTFQTQRNFRIHTTVGSLAILLSLYLKLTRVEIVIISLAISAVLMMELLNTAIESVVDLTVRQTYHELAKIAKDCAASAVLTSAFASVIVACYLWLPPLLVEIQTTAAGTAAEQVLNVVFISEQMHSTMAEIVLVAILVVVLVNSVLIAFSSLFPTSFEQFPTSSDEQFPTSSEHKKIDEVWESGKKTEKSKT